MGFSTFRRASMANNRKTYRLKTIKAVYTSITVAEESME
jgi:hypothetical protein